MAKLLDLKSSNLYAAHEYCQNVLRSKEVKIKDSIHFTIFLFACALIM